MHSGLIRALRAYLVRAPAWQQLLAGLAAVAAGAALVATGHLGGVALAGVGVLTAAPPLAGALARIRAAAGRR